MVYTAHRERIISLFSSTPQSNHPFSNRYTSLGTTACPQSIPDHVKPEYKTSLRKNEYTVLISRALWQRKKKKKKR